MGQAPQRLTRGPSWQGRGYRSLLWPRPGPSDEAVREVLVHGQGLADAQVVHHDEAQAIHGAVLLVCMPPEIVEGGPLLLEARPVDPSHPLAVEPLAHEDRSLVGDPVPRERDRLEDNVVGRDQQFGETAAFEFLEDLDHPVVVRVILGEEGEEEPRVDEDHSSG